MTGRADLFRDRVYRQFPGGSGFYDNYSLEFVSPPEKGSTGKLSLLQPSTNNAYRLGRHGSEQLLPTQVATIPGVVERDVVGPARLFGYPGESFASRNNPLRYK